MRNAAREKGICKPEMETAQGRVNGMADMQKIASGRNELNEYNTNIIKGRKDDV